MKSALESLLAAKSAGVAGGEFLQHLDFVARKIGYVDAAVPAYEAILELDPGKVDAYVALTKFARDKYAKARDLASR